MQELFPRKLAFICLFQWRFDKFYTLKVLKKHVEVDDWIIRLKSNRKVKDAGISLQRRVVQVGTCAAWVPILKLHQMDSYQFPRSHNEETASSNQLRAVVK